MARLIPPSGEPAKEKPTVAIVSVGFDAPLLRHMTEQVKTMPWKTTFEDSAEYFTPQSRPRWTAGTKASKTCIGIVDFDGNASAALDSVEFLLKNLPGRVSIIALTSDSDPSTILRAMRAGCSEYLPKPMDNHSFTEALARIQRRFAGLQEAALELGSVISVVGVKGGVGTTTLAIHLGIHLVANHKKKVLLIDNDPGLGHTCLYLGLEGTHYSFRDLLRNVNRLDADLLKGYVLHHGSGLDVVASAELHGTPTTLDADEVRRTLNFLREKYDYILVDCPPLLDEANMAIFEMSEQVFLVTTPDIGAVRDLSRLADGLLSYQQPKEKLHVVLNRASSKFAMSAAHIEKASRLPVSRNITNSYLELSKAGAMGLPVPPGDKSELSVQFREWSQDIVGEPAYEEPAPTKKRSAFWR